MRSDGGIGHCSQCELVGGLSTFRRRGRNDALFISSIHQEAEAYDFIYNVEKATNVGAGSIRRH